MPGAFQVSLLPKTPPKDAPTLRTPIHWFFQLWIGITCSMIHLQFSWCLSKEISSWILQVSFSGSIANESGCTPFHVQGTKSNFKWSIELLPLKWLNDHSFQILITDPEEIFLDWATYQFRRILRMIRIIIKELRLQIFAWQTQNQCFQAQRQLVQPSQEWFWLKACPQFSSCIIVAGDKLQTPQL